MYLKPITRPSRLTHWLLVVGLLLLAFGLRLIAIDQVPAGLSHDEAYNGVTAIQVIDGQRRIFFEINKGIEPLIIYLEALAFQAFGIGPVPLRLVNVIFGMLTVALVYPLTARLTNRWVALLAMAGLATSFWAIFVSRLTLRAVLLPPFLLLLLYFFWRALAESPQTDRRRWFLYVTLSGLVAGLMMYTYLSSRFVPLIGGVLFGYLLWRGRIRSYHWLGLLLLGLIWAALTVPLARYFLQNPDSFSRRADQVTTIPHLLNGEFAPTLDNTLRTLGMFSWQGDTTDRYNLDDRPVFDWFNSLFFYLGLGLVGWRLRPGSNWSAAALLLLSTFLFMLLPDFITDDSPHFLRTVGAMPLAYIFWALGLALAAHHVGRWSRRGWLSALFITLLLLLTTLHTGYDYFGRWATSAEARQIYGADIAEIAAYLKRAPDEGLPVISAEYYRDLDPFRFRLHFEDRPPFVIWFDGQQSLAFPPPEANLAPRYIFSNSAPPAEPWPQFLEHSPAESGQAYQLYRLPADLSPAPLQAGSQPVGVEINGELVLQSYQLLDPLVSGGTFRLLLGWQARRALPPGTDYTFLLRLKDMEGHVWQQTDGNGYAPQDWQPGVQALQLLTLRLPGDLPPRRYQLSVAVVDRRSGGALPAANGELATTLGPVRGRLDDKPDQIELDRLPNPVELDLSPAEAVGPVGLLLRGYQLEQRHWRPPDRLALTLHWQVIHRPAYDYQLQFWLVDRQGEAVSRWPGLAPMGGEWSTSQWPAGYWLQDKLSLTLPPTLPSGTFELRGSWVRSGGPEGTPFKLGQVSIEAAQ